MSDIENVDVEQNTKIDFMQQDIDEAKRDREKIWKAINDHILTCAKNHNRIFLFCIGFALFFAFDRIFIGTELTWIEYFKTFKLFL